MKRMHLDQDVRPLSEFRSNAAELVQQLRVSGRPLLLTQRGHAAAVVLAVSEYERLLDELELHQDVQLAEEQLTRGLGADQEEARALIRSQIRR